MGAMPQRHILAIEDNPDHLFLIKELLSSTVSAYYSVDAALYLRDGLARFRNGTYDAVLLDLTLPDSVPAVTFAAVPEIALKAPLIVLTNHDNRAMAEQALKVGADEYLLKGEIVGRSLSRAIENAVARFEQRRELREQALTDDLTGLLNRRGFSKLAEPQFAAERLAPGALAIVFMDVDGLKFINDRLGHEAGSRMLRDLAAILTSCFRETDLVARWGGDEFVACVQARSADAEAAILRRLNQLIHRYNAQPDRRYRLSISIGFARCKVGDEVTLDEMLARADAQMYEKKRLRKADAKPSHFDVN